MFQWGQGALEVKTPPTPPPSPQHSHDAATAAADPSAAAAAAGGADSEIGGATQTHGKAPAPAQSPGRADGWQLLGFTQHHPHTAQPVLLHRTMNKWAALKAAQQSQQPQPQQGEQHQQAAASTAPASLSLAATERNWPVQLVTGPLPTRWGSRGGAGCRVKRKASAQGVRSASVRHKHGVPGALAASQACSGPDVCSPCLAHEHLPHSPRPCPLLDTSSVQLVPVPPGTRHCGAHEGGCTPGRAATHSLQPYVVIAPDIVHFNARVHT